MTVFSVRWSVVVFLTVVITIAWALGLLPAAWFVIAALWSLSPVVVTLVYLAVLAGFAAMCAYPRYRPGVTWTEVVSWTPQPALTHEDRWGDDVVRYLASVRDDQDRAA